MALYGFGDAQIDAQNRATSDIGTIKAEYNNTKAASQLTLGYIAATKTRIQSVIANYNALYGNTSRGAAGAVTLQQFVDGYIYPELDADANALGAGTSALFSVPVMTTPTFNPSNYTDGNAGPINVNVSVPGSSSTPIAMGPSGTPGPPPGIEIPGTSVNVTAPDWLKNPYLWAAIGLGILYFAREK